MIDFGCTVELPNATRVEPGDILVGDVDGVVVIPKDHAEAVVADAMAKVAAEEQVRGRIARGESTQSVFAALGVM